MSTDTRSDQTLPPGPTLLLGGFLLAVMAFRLRGLLPLELVAQSWPLLLIGGVYLLLGLLLWLRIPRPSLDWLSARYLARVCAWWGIEPAQLSLLILAPFFAWLARLAAGDAPLAHDAQMAAAAWILAIAAVSLGFLRLNERPRPLEPVWSQRDTLAAAALFALALLLRITFLDGFPANLSGDEGSAGLEAVKFVRGETDNVLALGWFAFPSFYFWIQSWGIRLLGQTTVGLRILSALAGGLTIPAVYWLVRQLYDRSTAIAAAALLAAAHFHIHFSRIGLNNIWDGLFAVLTLGCLWRGWRSGERLWFILGGLLLGISQYFYVSMRIFPLIILLWAGLAFFLDRARLRRRFPDLVTVAAVSLIAFLPLLLYYVNHWDQFNAPLQRVSIFNGWLESEVALRQRGPFLIWLDQLRLAALGLIQVDLRHWYAPGAPLLLPLTAFLFVIGLLWSLWRPALRELLLLLPLAGIIFMSTFSSDLPSAQRYIIASPLALIIAARPLGAFYRRLAGLFDRQELPRTTARLILAAVLALLMIIDIDFYFGEASTSFVLGGINTEVATAAAHYLQPYEGEAVQVFFLGAPRMTFRSHSTLPYLVPRIDGQDFLEPLTAPPALPPAGAYIFIFLPERFPEIDFIKQLFPEGTIQAINNEQGQLLFVSYLVGLTPRE